MAPFRFLTIWLFLFLHPSVRLIEAVAAVSFQFIQSYASVQSSIDEFTSQLNVDLQTKYSFTSQHIESIQILASPGGSIQVTFDLDIDTRTKTLVAQRDRLKRDLIAPNYVFVFTNSTGASEAFLVDGGSASVTPSFWDGWHQYAPDILYAMLVGLVIFAMFCSAVYCLVAKQKRAKKENRMAPSAGHLDGINNEGYVVEMTQVYRVKNTESSPIPHQRSRPKEISVSVIAHSSPETTEPQSPDHVQTPQPPSPTHLVQSTEPQSPELLQSPQPSSPMQLQRPTETQAPILDQIPEPPAPMQSRKRDRPLQYGSVTTSESPTLETFNPAPPSTILRKIISTVSLTKSPSYSGKSQTSNITAKMASLQGSVRSSIHGFSTSTTPASSRRSSITGPSIYARLLFASYSVPPKKIYDYI